MVEHVSTIVTTMFTTCPLCGAQPLTPCVNGTRELRYTHAERNRA